MSPDSLRRELPKTVYFCKNRTSRTTLEKNDIKQALRELIQEDKDLVKAMLREILEEEAKSGVAERQAKVDAIIQRDFERYKNVFKALA